MSRGRLQETLVAWVEWILESKEKWDVSLLTDSTEL